jgi:hypothetical protein
MNRMTQRMLWLAGFALITASCSQPGPATSSSGGATSVGGATSNSGSSATGSGGSTSSGGTTTSAGGATTGAGGTTTSAGGVTVGAGGTTASAGGTTTSSGGATTSSGGSLSSGGVARTGGATTGSGGATTGSGGAAATGGGVARTGGATSGTGGTTATATGGAPGTDGTSGGTTIDPKTIVPTLDGYFWVFPASATGTATGANYPDFDASGNCSNTGAWETWGVTTRVVHKVGGTAGTQYTLNFELRGVLGTQCYTGGSTTATGNTQPSLAANPEVSNNGWYMGGSPDQSQWNTYEVHVKPAVGTTHLNPLDSTENVYYLNAFPRSPSGWCKKEGSFPMIYTASFPVTGGGTITLTMHDSNCLTQQNCGPIGVSGTCANAWRTVDISGMPQPAASSVLASMTQPYKQVAGSSTWYPQWALFAVRSVTSP